MAIAEDPPSTLPSTQPHTRNLFGLFSKDDAVLLEKYKGRFVPTGEGFFVRQAPVDGIWFARSLSAQEFNDVFPAIEAMDPHQLYLSGQRNLRKEELMLLSRLRSLRYVDLRRTQLTGADLSFLRPRNSGCQVIVSRDTLTSLEVESLRRTLPRLKME